MVENDLTEIPSEKWPELRDLYLKNWPENVLGYYTVDNFIRWIEKQPVIEHLKVYALNGDWTDGTFVVNDHDSLYVNTLNETYDRLTTLLNLIDWSSGLFINSLRKKHRDAVLALIKQKMLTVYFDDETLFYHIPKEVVQNFKIDISSGITVGTMTEEDVVTANSQWSFQYANSLSFLQRISALNLNVNLKKDDGELLAWCFRSPAGTLVAMQVSKNHQRKGLGSMVIKLMASKLAEIGQDTTTCVVLPNIASQAMFEKIGFRVIDSVFFVGIEATK